MSETMKLAKKGFPYILCLFWSVAILCSFPLISNGQGTKTATRATSLLATFDFQKPVFRPEQAWPETILIPEEKGWLVSVFGSFLQQWRYDRNLPSIMAIPEYDKRETVEFGLFTKNRQVESLVSKSRLSKFLKLGKRSVSYHETSGSALEISISVVSKYTVSTSDVIVAYVDQTELFLQASLLAAHLGVPVLPLDKKFDVQALTEFIKKSAVKRLISVTQHPVPVFSTLEGIRTLPLSTAQIQTLLLDKMGRKTIKNILVTSYVAEDFWENRATDDAVYYLPYISLLRAAPLVIVPSRKGKTVEKFLFDFIAEQGLQPRTITIVGDYRRVEAIKPDTSLKQTVFESDLELEPASTPENGQALAYGVGRLPFSFLSSMSLYYTRLQEQNHRYLKRQREFVMISNLKASEGPTLEFAETISRITSEELKNFGLKGLEFYADDPANSQIWKSLEDSGLIIYEGHIEQFLAFKDGDSVKSGFSSPPYFKRHPFMILQSCNSLETQEPLARRGVTGILGSSTKIHSASGSTFIKAYMDFVLYDGLSAGEALRDAKNYYLAVVELKKARDHQEQSKANRVALTFRLWGDPELQLFPKTLPLPKKQPVQAFLNNNGTIDITSPPEFMPRVSTRRYHLKMFPNAKQAGIVKSSKNPDRVTRRIESLYFFRLPYNQPTAQINELVAIGSGQPENRAVLLEDPFKRWFYVLYYPKAEKANLTNSFKTR